jgi:ATP-dependent DNA helicase RecQ
VKALSHLETHGDLVLQPSGVRQGYRLVKKPDDFNALTERLQKLFLRREQQDLDRLQQVLAYAETRDCYNQHLLSHFGEEMAEPCGHCANCVSASSSALPSSARPLPTSQPPEMTEEDTAIIQSLLDEKIAPLRTPRQLTRFLCGLTSPATARLWYTPIGKKRKARLTTHEAFGLLQNHPFGDALAYCESLVIP